MARLPVLDHIVINVRSGMDRAHTLFEDLGFTLTPRGHHTLGSINHLAIFNDNYLELLGLPADAADLRPELANAPVGLNGLVFKSDDVDATHAHLKFVGLAGYPPKSFSRPVALSDGAVRDACFRTVAVREDRFAAGRLYFCDHVTPDLLWRREWQHHENGLIGFRELTMVALEPDILAARLCRALDTKQMVRSGPVETGDYSLEFPSGFVLKIQTLDGYQKRFGDRAIRMDGRAAMFGNLCLRVEDIQATKKYLDDHEVLYHLSEQDMISVSVDGFDTLLHFSQ